jgi:hypothetical protein
MNLNTIFKGLGREGPKTLLQVKVFLDEVCVDLIRYRTD